MFRPTNEGNIGSKSLITSQLPTETWHEVIGELTFADAILDRHAYHLALDGPSIRKTQADQAAAELLADASIMATNAAATKSAKGARK